MNDTLISVQALITKLQNRNEHLEKQNKMLVKTLEVAESHILDELQALYDMKKYNASGDGDMPLIELEEAKVAVECFLSRNP